MIRIKLLKLKRVYFFFAFILVTILHFPLVYSSAKEPLIHSSSISAIPKSNTNETEAALMKLENVYDSLKLESKGLSYEAYRSAVSGYLVLKAKRRINNTNIISIADFSKSSARKRLFVIDVKNYKLLFNTYVAHGQNSGQEFATNFSNTNESLASSLGFYVTGGTYTGINGFSMYLSGMEPGFNDRAYERSIVMHGADYVSEGYIRSRGYIGRSWGCPAVAEAINKKIIAKIKGGSCFYIYSPNKLYRHKSKLAYAV